MVPAIFLDRDGVLIENRSDYVRCWNDVEIIPEAIQALVYLKSSPYKIVLVTNQSAVGRGIITLEVAQAINQQLIMKLEKVGCRIDGVFMCPHAPDAGCTCRKPLPGLLLKAAQALAIDFSRSIMIGDAWTDMQAGHAAGIERLMLVRTGRGREQLAQPRPTELGKVSVYETLADVVAEIP